MGKTPKPLAIWVDVAWLEHPKIAKLRQQGHTITYISNPPNIILSEVAHYWCDDFWKYLPLALKRARTKKYGTKASSP